MYMSNEFERTFHNKNEIILSDAQKKKYIYFYRIKEVYKNMIHDHSFSL